MPRLRGRSRVVLPENPLVYSRSAVVAGTLKVWVQPDLTMVGVRGFEPPASSSRTTRANRAALHPDRPTRVPFGPPVCQIDRHGSSHGCTVEEASSLFHTPPANRLTHALWRASNAAGWRVYFVQAPAELPIIRIRRRPGTESGAEWSKSRGLILARPNTRLSEAVLSLRRHAIDGLAA